MAKKPASGKRGEPTQKPGVESRAVGVSEEMTTSSERIQAIIDDPQASDPTISELSDVLEDRTLTSGEFTISDRAAEIKAELEDRVMHGGKRAAHDRLLSEALKRHEMSEADWKSMEAYAMVPERELIVESDIRLHQVICLKVEEIRQEVAIRLEGVESMRSEIDHYAFYRAKAEHQAKLLLRKEFERRAATDSLTGFVRSLAYAQKLHEVEVKRLEHGPDNRCMMVVVIDLNDFKLENERHPEGHAGVDRDILTPMAMALEGALRGIDIKGRPGGDELFFIINDIDLTAETKPGDSIDQAIISNDVDMNVPPQVKRILFKLQQAIESVKRSDGKPMTASIGFTLLYKEEAHDAPVLEHEMINGDKAAIHSKHLSSSHPGTSVITQFSETLPKAPRDFNYYKYMAKKGLSRVFPGEDLSVIDPIVDVMADYLASREVLNQFRVSVDAAESRDGESESRRASEMPEGGEVQFKKDHLAVAGMVAKMIPLMLPGAGGEKHARMIEAILRIHFEDEK